MRNWLLGFTMSALLAVGVAQPQPPRPPQGPALRGKQRPEQPPPGQRGPFGTGPLQDLANNPRLAERLGINADQQKKIQAAMQEHRLKQIDLRAALEKAQVTMQPLMSTDQPDEKQILNQIDKVQQAQADVQKDEMRLQLEIRRVLTADQWRRLQDERREPRDQGNQGPPAPPGRGKNAPPQQQ